MGDDRDGNTPPGPIAESIESRLMLSAGASPAAPTGISGTLRGDSFLLVVGARTNTIGGALQGDQLVIESRATTMLTCRKRSSPYHEWISVGGNTVGGNLGDHVSLVLRGNTIGGVVGLDGIRFALADNTIGGTVYPDRYTFGFTTVGGSSSLNVSISVGGITVGGVLGPETQTRAGRIG